MSDNLADLAALAQAATESSERAAQPPISPARSPAGRIRNVGAMSDTKLDALWDQMRPFEIQDPEGFAAIEAERERRRA